MKILIPGFFFIKKKKFRYLGNYTLNGQKKTRSCCSHLTTVDAPFERRINLIKSYHGLLKVQIPVNSDSR